MYLAYVCICFELENFNRWKSSKKCLRMRKERMPDHWNNNVTKTFKSIDYRNYIHMIRM